MFELLQGPSTWGWDNEFYAEDVEIKGPGTLDLTSQSTRFFTFDQIHKK